MFRRASLLIIFLCLIRPRCYFANGNTAHGARSSGLGNASVTLSDVWSSANNQAGLAYLENVSGGIYYEDRFLLEELSLKAASVIVPLKAGVFGISTSSFGNKLYAESNYGLAFAKTFGPAVAAGVQLNYLSTKIGEGYGNIGIPTVEMGLQVKLTKKLTFGSHIFNPTRAKRADYNNERIPTVMRMGMDYRFSEKVFIVAEVRKDIIDKPVFKLGVEYNPHKKLYLRTGFSTNPSVSTLGFGLHLKKLKIDFTSSFDSVLGFTPHAGLMYVVE